MRVGLSRRGNWVVIVSLAIAFSLNVGCTKTGDLGQGETAVRFGEVQRAWGRGLLAPDAKLWSAEVIPEPEGARSRVKGNRVQVRFWKRGSTVGSGEKFYDDGGIELGVGCDPGADAEFSSNSRSLTVRGFEGSTSAFYRGQPPSPGPGEEGDQQHEIRFVNWRDADGCVWGVMLGSRRYSVEQMVSILDGLLEVR